MRQLTKKAAFLILAVTVSAGCSLFSRDKDQPDKPDAAEKQAATKKQTPKEGVDEKLEKAPPRPPEVELPRVAVILGPGGVKTFAHAGVLKALHQARIPIDAVVGLEWGALVGAIFSRKEQVHEVEWQLYKLKRDDFPTSGFFSDSVSAGSIETLRPFLKSNVGSGKIENMKVPFACPSLSLWSGTVVWQDKGPLLDSLLRCLPYPPLFKPRGPWMAAAFAVPAAIQYLRQKDYDLIVFVNVLGRGELMEQGKLLDQYRSAILWEELRRSLKEARQQADEVIPVVTRQFQLLDFSSKKKLIKAGQKAGQKAASDLAEKYGF